MKVLVTGGKGFFGSWLLPGLIMAGHEATPFDIADGNDLFDVASLANAMRGCDAVIHLAAYLHFKPEIPATEFIRLNVAGVAKVVEAMRLAGAKRLVHTSSGAIYGFGPDLPLNGWVTPPITEEQMPTNWSALNAYSAAKVAAGIWLQLATPRGWQVTALRINCIEPHHAAAKDSPAVHWGWWCSQATAIRAYCAALERKANGFIAVNVGEPNTNLDLTRLTALLAGEL